MQNFLIKIGLEIPITLSELCFLTLMPVILVELLIRVDRGYMPIPEMDTGI
jgi:hypothetical protein